MRSLLRAGVIALAASSVVLGGGVAAQAAPAGEITVSVNRLIFEPGEYGHTGSLRFTIRNNTSEPFEDGYFYLTEPVSTTIDTIDGAGACTLGPNEDGLGVSGCMVNQTIAPGGRAVFTARFTSPTKPQPYAQRAPHVGKIEVVGGDSAEFPALFRSTTGSLRNPRPYVQDDFAAVTVTAGDVTLTRQEDGSFAGRVPVTAANGSDVAHHYISSELLTPPGVNEWPYVDPGETCGQLPPSTVPAGFSGTSCMVAGGRLAEGQTRTFDWVITAPAETPAGPLGTGTARVNLNDPGAVQTDGANADTFTITVAG